MEQTEREKVRRLNCTAEAIYRNHDDFFYSIEPPAKSARASYPWESVSNLPRITKDFFRCKGSSLNPPIVDTEGALVDCEGCMRHGLPIIHGKEGVYPILIDLLNYVQKKTGKRVVITSGHCCPPHNTYSNPAKGNRISKHQIGAEVDFYVQGMEDRPQEIVGLLMQYFQETPVYKNDKESLDFKRLKKSDLTVEPWLNKEIFIQLYQKHEGRDGDNRHPHPYIAIQVCYDRETRSQVVYEWGKAHLGYPRS